MGPDQAPPWDLLLLADPSRNLVEEYVSRGICYLAYLDEELVGEFVLIRTHPGTIEIVNVAVGENFQGRGIGKALVLRAIEESKLLHAKTIEIGTGSTGVKQLKLYQKCGFRMFAVDTDFFVKHYEEEIFEEGMRLRDMVRLRLEI
ncbi:GNAT family N-acetyltransferase [Cohnella herbarum]|uniref:GNAT family N-acetyltransferase n=2 Tax=Cohnella herbarum TaxID=2728023 RepID=A0A7Z2ZRG8_9BACL|nr:GNAT family N-acetyltransferase [Cohnella herbarum]